MARSAVAVLLHPPRFPFIALLSGGRICDAGTSLTGEDRPIGLFGYLFVECGLAWVAYRASSG
jgi:hypothetical protein